MTLVIFVATSVDISGLPWKGALSWLLIINVLSFVLIAVLLVCSFAPFASTMFHATSKFAYVNWCVFPLVLAKPMRLTIDVLSTVNVAVCKSISALPMLKTKLPLSFVPISILPHMHTSSVRFALGPAPYIRVSEYSTPDALTFFKSLFPFPFVELAIYPSVNPITVRLIIFEVTFILVSVGVPFHTSAISIVI